MTSTIFVDTWRQVQPPIRRLVIAMILLMASTASAQMPASYYGYYIYPCYQIQMATTSSQSQAVLCRQNCMAMIGNATSARNRVLTEDETLADTDLDAGLMQAMKLLDSGDWYAGIGDSCLAKAKDECSKQQWSAATLAFSTAIEAYEKAEACYVFGYAEANAVQRGYYEIWLEIP